MRRRYSNRLRGCLGDCLATYYNNDIFSAASGGVWEEADSLSEAWFASAGRYGERGQFEVDEKSIFDLASLTKPLVTLPAILHLIDDRKIGWEDTLESLLKRQLPRPFRSIKLHQLLAHSSGLAAHQEYWRRLNSVEKKWKREWLINEIVNGGLQYVPGTRHVYSDLGYLLLGFIVEIQSERRLDEYWRLTVAEPLELEKEVMFPVHSSGESYVPTGTCRWSGGALSGVVHDDNCRALGGIAGHAGLFGSCAGVVALCREFMTLYHGRPGRLPISPDTFKKACVRVNDSEWTCGFNLPSRTGSSSGRFFSPASIGHLGFTGVSFWIDVKALLIVCLLTNRVIKGENKEGIQALRPQFHDMVVSCLRENPRNSQP